MKKDPIERPMAVLASKQQNLHCGELRAALQKPKVPFREEDQALDFPSGPVVGLMTDLPPRGRRVARA
jgi:hypothetical protein